MIAQVGQALYVGAGLFWQAFWALAFGYAFSSLIQVLVPRDVIASYLGRPGLKETALAMLLSAMLMHGVAVAQSSSTTSSIEPSSPMKSIMHSSRGRI